MPIKLDGEKILITEGDQNYELERVKSYGYRDLSQETTQPPTITPTIQAEDITPEILTYKHDGSSNNQTTHSVTFDEDVVVDILIVGGGGAGGGGLGTGTGGGGGGGGQVRLIQSLEVNSGTSYEIKVGKGGTGLFNASYATGNKGHDSSFDTYISLGGGGGGVRDLNASATYTGGGAGGYGGSRGIGTGYSGGTGGANGSADRGAGGGAGSGGNGGNYSGDNGGDGGIGLDRIGDYVFAENFGTNYGYLEGGTTWFGGGGGGSGESLSGTNGIGKHGGSNGNNSTGISEDALWGGGSGGIALLNANTDYDGDGSNDHKVGDGGSGIVIIKIHRDITHKKVVLKYDYKEDKKYPTIAADATNLLAHYKFDGDFTDSSGNGNDLTVGAGTPTTTNTEKVIGDSANLLTDLDYLKNDTISLANKEFSVAFWIKMTSSASNHFFISQGTTTNNNYLQIGWVSNKYLLGFWNNDLNSATVYSGDINNWVHLVFMVRSNNNQVIYRNGIEIASRANTTAFNGSGDLRVGIRRDDVATDSFTGYMDDLRIYDKALSETEIADLYKQSIVARFKNPSNSSAVAASKDWKLISYEPTGNNWFPDGLLNDIPSDRFLAFIYEDSGALTWVMLQKSVIEGNHNWSTYSVPTGHGSISSIGRYNDELVTGSQSPIITTTTNVQSSSHFIYREESSSNWHSTPPANRRYYVLEEVIQTEYTISFPTPRLCDILIVAGGGGGSESHGGGGGAGSVIFLKDVNMNGNYAIKVGNGGGVSQNIGNDGIGFKGIDSEIYKSDNNKVIAEGGGAGGATANGNGGDGGSGGGGDGYVPAHSTGTFYPSGGSANAYTPVLEGVTGVKYGNAGGSGFIQNAGTGGGGGGAGAAGESATAINDNSVYGGVGIYKATISGVDYNFKTLFGLPTDNSIGEYHPGGAYAGTTYDTGVYFGGGGGGALWENPEPNPSNVVGGLGGGGTSGGYTPVIDAEKGLANSGGGGGGGGSGGEDGGAGGSGIVIIRYRAYGIKYDAQWKHQKNANIHFYGNVGIGTYANNNKLYVNGSVNVTGDYYKNNRTLTEWHNSTNGNIYKNYGNVGIGSAAPNYKLHVEGQIYAAQGGTSGSGNTAWTSTSDMRVKDNIKKASYIKCYNNINNIELYRFNYKPVLNNTRDINQLGFIAQEVEQIFPKSVKRNKMILNEQEQELLALDVTQINYTLFGAVKYLAEKVEALKQKVNKID